MQAATEWMTPFLKLFGVEEGNGISPFAVEIRSPAELGSLIQNFFKPPKRDPRGQQQRSDEVGDVEEEALSELRHLISRKKSHLQLTLTFHLTLLLLTCGT